MDKPILETIEVVQQGSISVSAENIVPATGEVVEMPKVRAMTRRQVKQMKAAGFSLLSTLTAADEDVAKFEDMLEWILTNVYADVDLDDLPNGECMRLAGDTIRLAAGEPTEEAKNS